MLTTTLATSTTRAVLRMLTRLRRTGAERTAATAGVAHHPRRAATAPWAKWLALG